MILYSNSNLTVELNESATLLLREKDNNHIVAAIKNFNANWYGSDLLWFCSAWAEMEYEQLERERELEKVSQEVFGH